MAYIDVYDNDYGKITLDRDTNDRIINAIRAHSKLSDEEKWTLEKLFDKISDEEIEVDDVVVIDNGMSYSNIGEVVANLYPLVYKLYITLEGDLERKTMKNKLTEQDEFIQLTIDDNREEVTK